MTPATAEGGTLILGELGRIVTISIINKMNGEKAAAYFGPSQAVGIALFLLIYAAIVAVRVAWSWVHGGEVE